MTRFFAPRLRRIAITIPLIAAMLVVTLPLGGCSLADVFAVFESDSPALAHEGPTAATVISERLDTFGSDLAVLADPSAEETATQTAREGVELFAGDFEELATDLEDQFAETREVLKGIDSPEKDEIQSDVEAEFAERADTLRGHLDAIDEADGAEELASAASACSAWLDEITPDEPHQPLGTELPHRIVDYEAGPPVLGTQVAPAYAPDLPDSVPSTLPVTPTEEDLAETIEVQFTEDIRSLVTTLGADPVAMYEYVRNTIDFEPYYGSRKDANETLLQGAGNDMDTASLLIAMYRNAGYPARYVSGVVDVPSDQAMNWVGVEVPEAAAKLFSAAGTPVAIVTSGGVPTSLRIEHTWAEVYVPYEDYQGAAGSSADAERAWLPLDASFKQYEVAAGPDWSGLASVNGSGTLEPYMATVSLDATAGTATGGDLAILHESIAAAWARAKEYAADAGETPLPGGARAIKRTAAGLLPSAPPLQVLETTRECSELPADVRESLALSLPGIEFSAPTASLAGKRLAIAFSGASEKDRELAEDYESIGDIPAYLLDAVPVILIDGVTVAIGAPAVLGEECEVGLAIGSKGRIATDRVVVGGFYTLSMALGRTSRDSLTTHLEALDRGAKVLAAAGSDPDALFRPDEFFAELIGMAGSTYFSLLTQNEYLAADIAGVSAYRSISLAMTGTQAQTARLLGTPCAVLLNGLFIDVDRDASVVAARDGDNDRTRQFMAATGAAGSALEHRVWEALFAQPVRGMSAARAMEIAARDGVPVHSVDAENIAEKLATLDLPSSVERDIADAAAGGYNVVVPEHLLEDDTWRGVGYVVEDPSSGATGYMLANGTGGGSIESTLLNLGSGVVSYSDLPPETIDAVCGAFRMICTFLLAMVRTLANDQIRQIAVMKCLQGIGSHPLDFLAVALSLHSMATAYWKVLSSQLSDEDKQWMSLGIASATASVLGGYEVIKRVDQATAGNPGGRGWKYLAGWIWGMNATIWWGGVFPYVLENWESQ